MQSPYKSSLGGPHEEARIVVVAEEGDPTLKELDALPARSKVIFRGGSVEEFSSEAGKAALGEANVLLNCCGDRALLEALWPSLTGLQWLHSRFAGVDHILFPALRESSVKLTNSRGLFSPALGEYVVLACLYFAKDVDRWKRQQGQRVWGKFVVSEINGKTLGILGYGDIGQVAGRMAKGMGMRVIAQRRRPELSKVDGIADEVYGSDEVGEVISRSDYVLLAAALTPETKGMVGAAELARARPEAVLINVGRGPLLDEGALIEALDTGRLRGAALDVFCEEPLPQPSPLWGMDNVLLSPHNADMTSDFLHRSVRLFASNMANFLTGTEASVHGVDLAVGY